MFLMTGHSHSRYVQTDKTCFVQVNRKDYRRVTEAGKLERASKKAQIEAEKTMNAAGRKVYSRIYAQCDDKSLKC